MAGGWNDLGLCPEILRAIEELGWLLPTDVQDESIPLIMGGGDVMAAAETGKYALSTDKYCPTFVAFPLYFSLLPFSFFHSLFCHLSYLPFAIRLWQISGFLSSNNPVCPRVASKSS